MKKITSLVLILILAFSMSTTGVFAATGPSVTEVGTKLNSFGQDTSNWEFSQEHGVKGFSLPGQYAPGVTNPQKVVLWEKQGFLSVMPSGWELSANSTQSITEIDTKGKHGIIILEIYQGTEKNNKFAVVKTTWGEIIYSGPVVPAPKLQDMGTFADRASVEQPVQDFCLYIQGM